MQTPLFWRFSAAFLGTLLCIPLQGLVSQYARPLPYPVPVSRAFTAAVEKGTRTMTGAPGPEYWMNSADYVITARLFPDLKRLEGSETIQYKNNSPDTLRVLQVSLLQNFHMDNAARNVPAEATGGIEIRSVAVAGTIAPKGTQARPRYTVNGTTMTLVLDTPVPPRGSIHLAIDWAFKIPQAGIASRMGIDSDSLFFLAYWYPQMLVYDDVVGWQNDQFLGIGEFYADFANYDVSLQVPEGWILQGSGKLQNAKDVFSDRVFRRLTAAEKSDTTYRILNADEYPQATRKGTNGWLTWRFKGERLRDVAWVATRHSNWDAARALLGGGATTVVHSFWRPVKPRWAHSVRYAQHSLRFLSSSTGISYAWPHMTLVEAGGIINGAMEYPMMTLCGDFFARTDIGLYGVLAHEIAHMWVPLMVSVDERRASWMDEGITMLNTHDAVRDFDTAAWDPASRHSQYLGFARTGNEGEVMRWTNFHYSGGAYTAATYSRPSSALHALRGVLGEETFTKAFRTLLKNWSWKHIYPWDLFHTFSAVSGRNLDWFVRAWFFETWTLDHAVTSVEQSSSGTTITVEDKGWIPMPVLLTLTYEDGTSASASIPVEEWLAGKKEATAFVPGTKPVVRVEIDEQEYYPDFHRSNNVWTREETK